MRRRVIVLPEAEVDLSRLEAFLADKSLRAANRAAATLFQAVRSLGENSERRPVISSLGLRELPVRFGRDGYIIQYRILGDAVHVGRIFHAREDR